MAKHERCLICDRDELETGWLGKVKTDHSGTVIICTNCTRPFAKFRRNRRDKEESAIDGEDE